ncbi:MAG: hypothetical protein II841_04880 [Bacteroidales bacterium]|nr:hypothetical protein [Bacteroidales bacterium]
MAKLTIVKIDQALPLSLLEEFKQYAAVPDGSRDAMLTGLLTTALLRVQEYADTALLACTAKQVLDVPEETGVIRLYLGGGDVESLTTTNDGNSVPYDPLTGGKLNVFVRGCEVEIVFKTRPNPGDLERVKATVLRYATGLYDGEDAGTLGSILNEVL